MECGPPERQPEGLGFRGFSGGSGFRAQGRVGGLRVQGLGLSLRFRV